MNDKIFFEWWSKTREKGYTRFIGVRSSLCFIFGLLGGILTMFLTYITWDKTAFESIWLYVGAGVSGSTLAGLIVSNTTWKSNEKRYLKQ